MATLLSEAFPRNKAIVQCLNQQGITTVEQALNNMRTVELTRNVGKMFLHRLKEFKLEGFAPKPNRRQFPDPNVDWRAYAEALEKYVVYLESQLKTHS